MRSIEIPSVGFASLPLAALERYAQHYGIDVIDVRASGSLLQLVQDHFARSSVDESQALAAFERANSKDRVESPPTVDRPPTKRRASMHETPRKQKKARALTYGDMISVALKQLPSNQGTLDEICDVIEKQYSKQLNHELESGPRRITVWRASVRKIINLNYGMRFHRLNQEAEGNKAVFCLAKTPRGSS